MTLHTKILDACREEVAKKSTYFGWKRLRRMSSNILLDSKYEEAALLAMEKQAEFFRHISRMGWIITDEDSDGEPIYETLDAYGPQQTELELYEIFTTQQ